jgi:acetyltransferase-like isoleucine patch superfamily enzyme
MPGIRIGKNARIGAGSVVTKNVEAQSLVFGVAAKAPSR